MLQPLSIPGLCKNYQSGHFSRSVHIIALWQNVLLIVINKKKEDFNYLQYTYEPEDQVC